jgi:hypothetical protein
MTLTLNRLSVVALSAFAALSPAPVFVNRAPVEEHAWVKGEAYGVLVERGPIGAPPAHRELFIFHPVRGLHAPWDLLVLSIHAQSGYGAGAYRLELRSGTRQPRALEPLAVMLDANRGALRAQSDGPSVALDTAVGDGFFLVQAPWLVGSALLPYWVPAVNGSEPIDGAHGKWIVVKNGESTARPLVQSWRRNERGDAMVSFRNDDDGARVVGSAQFRSRVPFPIAGQVLDTGRGEHTRFRLAFHADHLAAALSLGRADVAGDPEQYPPERLLDAETVWRSQTRDLVAEEVLQEIAAERKWTRLDTRRSLPAGELFPYVYELFALQAGVLTGADPKPVKIASSAAPRGTVGLLSAGRYETQESVKLEAWMIPGADERAVEGEKIASTAESSGKLLFRTLLGKASPGLIGDRGIYVDCDPGWFVKAAALPGNAHKMRVGPVATGRRGSDAILVRRESDLAPVVLVVYRLSSDLRFARVLATQTFDGTGPVSVVRRSLLERAKDYFLAGGFTAFTQKKGASILLTRDGEETTQIDRVDGRGCSVEFLEERELPEEPWKLTLDPRAAKGVQWGHVMGFALGRNKFGENRPPRDGIVRRTDGEELLTLEAWELDNPWWSEAIAAYPQQRLGVRFRQLVHSKLETDPSEGDGNPDPDDLLPFRPPPPPPQPSGNPKTKSKPPSDSPPPKAKPPAKKPPAPPPPAPGTPKTGGG